MNREKLRLLLVDDDPDDRTLVIHELQKEYPGLEVDQIYRPEALDRALERLGFDLVITDFRLNWTDGLQVLARVRAVRPDCPVIMFTGTGNQEIAVEAMKEGLDDYVVKSPLHLKRLQSAVGAVLEKKRTLRRADQQLLQLAAIVQSSDDAIIGLDLQGSVTSWNRGAQRIYGYAREEIIGRSMALLAPEGRESQLEQILELTREGQHIEHLETLHRRKDGKLINMSLTISPIFDAGGRVTSASTIGSDITQRVSLEQQLRQAQKMEALGTLAGGIAHDFNNVLTAIIGHASLLNLKLPKDEPLLDHVHQILEAASRGANLTQALLGFSRKAPLETRPVSLNGIIRKVERLIVMLLKEEVTYQAELSPEDPTIMADPGQIEQVLINLATNARDAIPSGGAIRIATSVFDLDQKFVRAHGFGSPGRYASLSFSDNGAGMEEPVRLRIFEPFFTTKGMGKGTGLGLAIVYGIVKQHNGYINCYSEPGQGTTFQIYLPITTRELVPQVKAPETPPPGGSETILVAEDDEATRALDRKILEAYGYRVIEAVDGQDAIDKFRQNPEGIALLFLDSIMPRKNGKEVYQEISRIAPGVKVLFTSGYTAENFGGIDDRTFRFIAKPILPTQLLKTIREVLDHQ